jgi:hypothetical protein
MKVKFNDEEQDSLRWARNSLTGNYLVKLGYLALAETKFDGLKKWWWSPVWKSSKMQILLWLVLENKLLTWEIGLRRGWIVSS